MGLMRRSRVVPIARGISEVLSGPGVKITEVTAVTWLSVSPRLLQISHSRRSPLCVSARPHQRQHPLVCVVCRCTATWWVTALIAV